MSNIGHIPSVPVRLLAVNVRRTAVRWAVVWALLAGVPLVLACGSDSLIPPALPNQAALYWSLDLSHHAVTLALTPPYDTLSLTAIPRNYQGAPLTGLPAPQYVSHDLEHVAVTAEGQLIAVARTSQPVWIYASLTVQNLKHTDSVLVQVVDTATPPRLASLSIRPIPPDSAKVTTGTGGLTMPSDTLWARAVDENNVRIPTYAQDGAGMLPMYFRSADPSIATIDRTTGEIQGYQVGQTTIYVETTAFGITKADTLPYRVGWSVLGVVLIDNAFTAGSGYRLKTPEYRIGTGGFVVWAMVSGTNRDTVDITFTDADLPNVAAVRPVIDHLTILNAFGSDWFCAFDCDHGGNFFLVGSDDFWDGETQTHVGRYFPVPGTYEYHSTRYGLTGRIIVVDER